MLFQPHNYRFPIIAILLLCASSAIPAEKPDIKPETRYMNFLSLGKPVITETNSDIKYDGIRISFLRMNVIKVTNVRILLGYTYGENKTILQRDFIYQPEISLITDVNLMAMSVIRNSLPKLFKLKLIASLGGGIDYLPLHYRTIKYNNTFATSDEGKWYWDHAALTGFLVGGIVLDEILGITCGLHFTESITGKHLFRSTDLRFGVVYII